MRPKYFDYSQKLAQRRVPLKLIGNLFVRLCFQKCFLAFQLMQLVFVTLPNLAKFIKTICNKSYISVGYVIHEP